jgi:glutamine cyclotransferase
MMIPLALLSGAVFLFFMPFNSWGQSSGSSLDLSHRINEIEVVAEFPHDPDAFTQGLLYAGNDTLFESTGLYGKSSVRKVDLRTGKVWVSSCGLTVLTCCIISHGSEFPSGE